MGWQTLAILGLMAPQVLGTFWSLGEAGKVRKRLLEMMKPEQYSQRGWFPGSGTGAAAPSAGVREMSGLYDRIVAASKNKNGG